MNNQDKPSLVDQIREYIEKNGNPKAIYMNTGDYIKLIWPMLPGDEAPNKCFGIDIVKSPLLRPGELVFSQMSAGIEINVDYMSDKTVNIYETSENFILPSFKRSKW